MEIKVGDQVPLCIQLQDGAVDQHVRAVITDDTGSAVAGSPVTLPHLSNGLYKSDLFLMPNFQYIRVQYLIYTDSGFTVLSTTEGIGLDVVNRGGTTADLIAAAMACKAAAQAITGGVVAKVGDNGIQATVEGD